MSLSLKSELEGVIIVISRESLGMYMQRTIHHMRILGRHYMHLEDGHRHVHQGETLSFCIGPI